MEPLQLIQIIKEFPQLYDRTIKCSLGSKTKLWAEIGSRYGLTGSQMQSRWRTIRDRYILFKRKVNTPPGKEGEVAPDYKYAEFLTFLDDTISGYQNLNPKTKPSRYVPYANSWERPHTLLLIKQLSYYPLLFDNTHPYYNHSHQRMAAYRKISNAIKPYKPEVTPKMVSRKIRTVRTQFAKEKRDHKKHRPNFPFVPKLWFYNRLTYIEEKRTYDPNNLETFGTTERMEDIEKNFDQNFEEVDADYEYVDKDVEEDSDVDEDDEEYNDVDEWIPAKDSTRPFEEVHIKINQLEHDYANDIARDNLDDEMEEMFDEQEPKDDHKITRNELYFKCTGLLDSLAKQVKTLEKVDITQEKDCYCKNSPPSTLLGKMIETELDKVPEHIYVDAKWKIIRILEEAQMKTLREKSN